MTGRDRRGAFCRAHQSPNVVRIYDIAHSAELTYIVMEYIDGAALSKQLTLRGRLEPSAVVQIGLDVVAGLEDGVRRGVPLDDLLGRGATLDRVAQGAALLALCASRGSGSSPRRPATSSRRRVRHAWPKKCSRRR